MTKIAPIKLPGGDVLYMEIDENVQILNLSQSTEMDRDKQIPLHKGLLRQDAVQKLQDITGVLQSMAAVVPHAFKQVAGANVDKVTLSFGIKLGGEAGIPYLTKGTAEGNITMQIECTFPKETGDRLDTKTAK